MIMNVMPVEPKFDLVYPRTETLKHEIFKKSSEQEKDKILLKMALNHYLSDQKKPFDLFFPKISLRETFQGKEVLDLGCSCGGEAVSFAERWSVKRMHGLEVNECFVRAARLFSNSRKNKSVEYDFRLGFAEDMPYDDNFFDAIVNRDVFEHVKSLRATLRECKRVLKPKGIMLSVFPSYYFPFGGAHLTFVTNTPFIQWFFSPGILMTAYNDIIMSRGREETYWYANCESENQGWQKLYGGIGINGTTILDFIKEGNMAKFSKIIFVSVPLLSVSNASVNHPKLKVATKFVEPLLHFKVLQDYLSHRIVSILIK
jgi:ubiquinone/menaquinone biosynthesis C-methylase UbiE